MKHLLAQTYTNYEIIVINDGSFDQTAVLLKQYETNFKVHIFHQKNQGLSHARNVGVSHATGDFLLFVDIDDTVPDFYLETIESHMDSKMDLLKFNYATVYETGKVIPLESHFENTLVTGEDAFTMLTLKKEPFELAVLYAYRKSFFQKHHFSFAEGMYHEDYGLIPYIILKSKKIQLLDDVLYYYYQTENSITRNNQYEKIVNKANDIFLHSQYNKEKIMKEPFSDYTKKIYLSYMANAILQQYPKLKGKEKVAFSQKIKENHILEDLLVDTWKRKLKKIMWKIKIR